MIESGTDFPIEYYKRIHIHGRKATGFPRLHDYGQDGSFTWIFEEYLDDTLAANQLFNGIDTTTFVGNNLLDCALEACSILLESARLLDDPGTGTMICPDNIRFGLLDGRRLKVTLTGLDEIIAPMYPDLRSASEYYDYRYAAPECLYGAYGQDSSSYSMTLSLLSAVAGEHIYPVARPTPADEPSNWFHSLEQRYVTTSGPVLPEGYEGPLLTCLEKDFMRRSRLSEAIADIEFAKEPNGEPAPETVLMSVHTDNRLETTVVLGLPSLGIELPLRLDKQLPS